MVKKMNAKIKIKKPNILSFWKKEKKNNTLSVFSVQDGAFTTYNLPPVSTRGIPGLINFDLADSENILCEQLVIMKRFTLIALI